MIRIAKQSLGIPNITTLPISGDAASSVSGSIINGVFQGKISTGSNEVYHVERKEYHPPHPNTAHDQVHSVIYKQDDVDIDKFNE